MPTEPVSFRIVLSSSETFISSRVVGWSSTIPGNKGFAKIAVLAVSLENEDFLPPAPLVSARDTNFYSDRRFRMLTHAERVGYLYVSGTIEGILPSGLVQMQLNNEVAPGSGGTPIWDLETGHVLGILNGRLADDSRIAFMAPTQAIAAAWPDLEVGFVVPESFSSGRRKKPKIFICHATEDSDIAAQVYERLEQSGYDPWLDKKSIIAGQKWDYEIKKAVKEAEFFVILLSQSSVSKKGYIQREFKLAIESLEEIPEGRIYLIPIKIDDCLVPTQFAAFQWVDLKGSGSYEEIRKAIHFQLSSAAKQSSSTKIIS